MMKLVIFAGLFAVAFAAPKEASVGIEKAQFPWQWPMMGNGMGPWNSMPQYNNNNQYPIDYSMSCSNQCQCASVCVPWFPCGCQCPPPCPPAETTTTTTTTTTRAPLCENGLPDEFYPWCCDNGAENWACETPENTPPPTTSSPCDGGNCCVPCMPCRPCMIWWMCSPCNCNNGCATNAPTTPAPTTTTPPPPLCWNGLPDSYAPFCCTNGAMNWGCEIVSAEPPTTTSNPCVPPPCRCQPCMPWMPCQPCSCPNPCQQG